MNAKDVTVEDIREIILPGLMSYLEGVASSAPEYASLTLAIADDAARWAIAKWREDPEADRALIHLEAQGKLLKSMMEMREGKRIERNFVAMGRALGQVALRFLFAFATPV